MTLPGFHNLTSSFAFGAELRWEDLSPEGAGRSRYRAVCRHHDDRIWTITIDHVREPVTRGSGTWIVRCGSGGCRNLGFSADKLVTAKLVAMRFANMDKQGYDRLVVDATSTATHPVSSVSAVVMVARLDQAKDPEYIPLLLLGSVDVDNRITLHPTPLEIEALLTDLIADLEADVLAGDEVVALALPNQAQIARDLSALARQMLPEDVSQPAARVVLL